MKLLFCVIATLFLASCSKQPGTEAIIEDDSKILQQHACLTGTWMATTVDITINNEAYSRAADPAFLIINGQTSGSNPDGDAAKKYYIGQGSRAWSNKNNATIDIHSTSWNAEFDRKSGQSKGNITLESACKITYPGEINTALLPQCSANNVSSLNLSVELDCKEGSETLSIINDVVFIRYSKIKEDDDISDFSIEDFPELIPNNAPDLPVFDDDEIIEIIKQQYPDLPDETIDDIIDNIVDINVLPLGDPEEPLEQEPSSPSSNPKDTDTDKDGVIDSQDAFPLDPTETEDFDGDSIGNNADTDDDNDGVPDVFDAFPFDRTESEDTDGDNIGNNFDSDDDGDLVMDSRDAFPLDSTEWVDTDNDGIGNNKDDNDDNDPALDIFDAYPLDPSEWLDTDGDGIGDNSDSDIDNDSYPNSSDSFPLDNTEWSDLDNDGFGDNSDTDIDGDGHTNTPDAFPYDATEWSDFDGDGIGDNSDQDTDGDNYENTADAFPYDPTEWSDLDGDGIGDNSDDDIDGDGLLNEVDPDPYSANFNADIPPSEGFITQTFSQFQSDDNSTISDYDLGQDPNVSDFIDYENRILFEILWQEDALALLANQLGYDLVDMDNDLAKILCPPQQVFSKASLFSLGSHNNMIAQMESSLSVCGIANSESVNLKMQSYIPTTPGYQYKASLIYATSDDNPAQQDKSLIFEFAGQQKTQLPISNSFTETSLTITANNAYHPLVIYIDGSGTGLTLIDNIVITELGGGTNYEACNNLFASDSEGFTICMAGNIDISQGCQMQMAYSGSINVSEDHAMIDNLYDTSTAVDNQINFTSLGLKGVIKGGCTISDYAANFLVHNKRMHLQEISWFNENYENHPEQAQISIHLESCDTNKLNGNSHIGLISTGESFSFDFTEDEQGNSYSGCRLKEVTLRDKTSNTSPSTDGADLNAFYFSNL